MIKRYLPFLLPLIALVIFVVPTTGCVVHARRPVHSTVVVAPPARVYYNGQWLYYRNNAYYYYDGYYWVPAPAVPTHVRVYHRPRVVRHRPVYHQQHRRVKPVHRHRRVRV